ncbi:MAG: hypothetical protein QXJ51_00945 [Sulfolobales archaeon]
MFRAALRDDISLEWISITILSSSSSIDTLTLLGLGGSKVSGYRDL